MIEVLGIDIGGSGIKGALVDVVNGRMTTDRYRIPTPQPSEPHAVADVVAEIVAHFKYDGPVGCTFPAVVKRGITLTAANVDDGWIGIDAEGLFVEKTNLPFLVLNDADAAGIAEFTFGEGVGNTGTVIMLTLGTGIGSAIFVNRTLLPNTEFGHMEVGGVEAEDFAADVVRKAEDLSWKKWGKRVNRVLQELDKLFWPDLYIIGGGVSKKSEKYFEYFKTRTPVVPAALQNEAGIIGAAMAAAQLYSEENLGLPLGASISPLMRNIAGDKAEVQQEGEN
ncbi:MAG: ROK family protein [Chloroflexota bacterium]